MTSPMITRTRRVALASMAAGVLGVSLIACSSTGTAATGASTQEQTAPVQDASVQACLEENGIAAPPEGGGGMGTPPEGTGTPPEGMGTPPAASAEAPTAGANSAPPGVDQDAWDAAMAACGTAGVPT